MKISDFLTKQQKEEVVRAIEIAETETSGEIRVHIESTCKKDVLDRAVEIFANLKMHKTALRNGILIYLAINDKKFAIIGDVGINSKVPDNFWDSVKDDMARHFKENRFTEGLICGIGLAGEKLKTYFPFQSDDVNELPNEISFGK